MPDSPDLDDELPLSLFSRAIDPLPLPPEIKTTLRAIQADVSLAYQQQFMAMAQTLNRQASAIDRMQATLAMLVEKIDPARSLKIPTPIKVVEDARDADVAVPLILADPMGAGFVMSQADLAAAVGLAQPTVSVLVRAFKLQDDEDCAVVVRRGRSTNTVNYHPRAAEKFRQYLREPPPDLDRSEQTALSRARRDLSLDID